MKELTDLQSHLDAHKIDHFRAKEVCWLPRLQKHVVPPLELWNNLVPTLKLADAIRREWGGPINVLSGYRTANYNRAIGGAANSQHLHFRALDLTPKDGRVKEFQALVGRIVAKWRGEGNQVGMGTYKSFVHIDVGFKTRDWQG
jgi:uncharacterized protein YcbK (DUF882 family)